MEVRRPRGEREYVQHGVQLTDQTLAALAGDEERGLERRQPSLLVQARRR